MDDESSKKTSPDGSGNGDDGMVVLSYVLSGILLYGGLGWAGAHFLGQTWMLPVGLILGLALSLYMIVKRYGSPTR